MKKLKLELDRIQVASFEVGAEEGRTGTVHAFSAVGADCPFDSVWSCRFCYPEPLGPPQPTG